MDRKEIENALGGSEFFKDMPEGVITKVAGLCRVENYENGEFVFQQGDYGESLYIIAQGQVFLERETNLRERKGNVVISNLGKGRILGCWSTLLGEPHILMSSAVCQKQTTAVAVKGADLRRMMEENRDIGFHVMERLCFILRDRIQCAYGALEKI